MSLAGSKPAYNGTRTVDGESSHRVTASAPANHDVLAAWESVDAISTDRFEALVSEDGLVGAYRLTYVATVDGERRWVVRSARWTRVENATVPVPSWYETARERTGN